MKKYLATFLCALFLLGSAALSAHAAENVALGKPVWSSTVFSEAVKNQSFTDGNYLTYWASGTVGGTNVIGAIRGSIFIAVDLGGYYDIDEIKVFSSHEHAGPSTCNNLAIHVADELKGEWIKVGNLDLQGYGGSGSVYPRGLTRPYRWVIVEKTDQLHFCLAECEVYGSEKAYDPNARQPLADVNGTVVQESADLLDYLGILPRKTETRFESEFLLTRGEAAQVMLKLLRQTPWADETLFSDVTEAHTYASAIACCARLGIVTGEGSAFRPDDYITPTEFLSMVVSAMGYAEVADRKGGYPNGVLSQAVALKLVRGNVEASFLSRGEAAQILYNALKASPLSVYGIEGQRIQIDENGETLLETVFDLSLCEGVVTANGLTDLYTCDFKSTTYVRIDSQVYTDDTGLLQHWLGRHVRVLCDDENHVLLAFESGKSTVYKVDCRYLTADGNSTLVFDNGEDRRQRYMLNGRSTAVIRNRIAYDDWKLSDFVGGDGYLQLIDSDSSGEIDVLQYFDPEIVVVNNAVSSGDNTLKLFGANGVDVVMEAYEKIEVSLGGNARALSSVKTDDLAYVYRDTEHRYAYVELVQKSICGRVEAVSDEDLTIDGALYAMAESYKSHQNANGEGTSALLDKTATFLLDRNDEIIFMLEKVSGSEREQYGVIAQVGQEGKGLSATLKLRIFTQEGKFELLSFAEKTTVDGIKYTTEQALQLGADYFTGKPCLYRLQNGLITFIDTPTYNELAEPDSEMVLMKNASYSAEGVIYSKTLGMVMNWGSMVMPIQDDIISFVLPQSGNKLYYAEEMERNYHAYATAAGALGSTAQLNTLHDRYEYYGNNKDGYPMLILAYNSYNAGNAALSELSDPLGYNVNTVILVDQLVKVSIDGDVAFGIRGYKPDTFEKISVPIDNGIKRFYDTFKTQHEKNSWHSLYYGNLQQSSISAQSPDVLAPYISEINDLKRGDIVAYGTNSAGVITAMERIYSVDYGKNICYPYGSNHGNFYSKGNMANYMSATLRLFFGTVDSVKRGYAVFNKTDASGNVSQERYQISKIPNCYVLRDGKFMQIAAGSVQECVNNPKAGILIYSTGGNAKAMIVYEDWE